MFDSDDIALVCRHYLCGLIPGVSAPTHGWKGDSSSLWWNSGDLEHLYAVLPSGPACWLCVRAFCNV